MGDVSSGLRKNTLKEGHVLAVTGLFVDGFQQLDPKQLNHQTCMEISGNDRYLKEYMTSNNETVSRQMPWGNTAKTMTSNGKQFTVTREMLTAVARHRWNLSAVFKFSFCFVSLYNKSLNDWSLGEQ